jgi:hypothetical protein
MRSLHRMLGLVLLAPILVWAVTGLLFQLKPGWDAAYASLDGAPPAAVLDPRGLLGLDAAVAAAKTDAPLIGARLIASDLGPMWRLDLGGDAGGRVLIDARDGRVRSPLDEAAVRALVNAAVARATRPERYGAIQGVALGGEDATVRFAGGATVTVGRHDAALAQRGPDTDTIDLLYRLHYLQWTESKAVNRVLAVVGVVGLVLLALVGVALLLRARRPGPTLA